MSWTNEFIKKVLRYKREKKTGSFIFISLEKNTKFLFNTKAKQAPIIKLILLEASGSKISRKTKIK